MKKIMLIGESGCGKTTLIQKLLQMELKQIKTQTIEFCSNLIDTPGEYVESRHFYSALLITSIDCDIVLLLQDSTKNTCIFPPNFAIMFNKQVVGVITKIDKKTTFINTAKDCLLNAGVSKIFLLSSYTGEGIDLLTKFLYADD